MPEWYENKWNFPALIVASPYQFVVVNHYSNGFVYDTRDNPYRIKNNTNWKLATKQQRSKLLVVN